VVEYPRERGITLTKNLERGGVANSFALDALCSREQYEDDYQSGSLDI
jgi:hypothetical protein